MPDPEVAISGVPALGAGENHEWAVEQHYLSLYKFAFCLVGSERDATNLIRDTYRVLLTKGEDIRDAHKVKSWLFTTLYRQFLGRRHARCLPDTTVEWEEYELRTISPQHIEALEGSPVITALQKLDENYRAPVAMFYLEELSYKKMAEVLELSIDTIMSRISRGKEILRRRLQEPSII